MTTRPDRTIEHWETTAVTALPAGWRNVYKLADGTVVAQACPVVLLQEHRATERVWDVPGDDGAMQIRTQKRNHEPPYETRAIFAEDAVLGHLGPVDDTSNYVGTVGPDEDPNVYADQTTAAVGAAANRKEDAP